MVLYMLLCKKMTIYSKFNRRYFFACVTKNQNPLSTCTSLICVQMICKTSYLEICRRSYLYNIPLRLPHSLCPPAGPPFSPFQSQGFSTGKPDLNLTKNSMTIKVRQKWICLYKDEKTCRPKLVCYLKFNNYPVYNTNI